VREDGAGAWQAVLFDLDGTLADTIDLIVRSFRHTMEHHLGGAPPDEVWLATIGRPLRDSLGEFARHPGQKMEMLKTYVAFQREVHDDLVRPYPGALEALEGLRDRGVPMAVVTSKGEEIARRTLGVCGMEGHFAVLVTADQVERGKPDPEPVHRALDLLGLNRLEGEERREVLFVGDSPFDMEAGRRGGVQTAAALWGPFGREQLTPHAPDHWLEHPDDLGALRRG
jgi:pyrophosphatase PpaX